MLQTIQSDLRDSSMVKILVSRNKTTFWSPHRVILAHQVQKNMPKRHCEPPHEVSPLRDRRSFETDDEYTQYLTQRRKQQETLRDRQRHRHKSVRVRSASASRLSGVRRLPPKQPPKQQPPRPPSSRRRGSVRQRSSGWQHSSSAHVHSLSARDVPCRYGLQ